MQYFSIALLLTTTLMAGAIQAEVSGNLCEGLFTGNQRVAIPAAAKPPFMKYY